MARLLCSLLLTVSMAVGLSSPASPHHSHSMFDHANIVTITGTVTEFSFRNPHLFLFIDVESENGDVVNYWIEMATIPGMIKRGIGAKTFQPGDVITANLFPLMDGRPGGSYHTIVAADGKTYD